MKPNPNYPQKSFTHVIVAVDVVIFTIKDNALQVLLLELNEQPFSGQWAVPGGLVQLDESLDAAARRHLSSKAGIKNAFLEQLYTFGETQRDPKGRVVSVAYFALLPDHQIKPSTISRYKSITWHPVKSLPTLAYDHKQIITTAITRLQNKLEYTNIAYSLLPKEFTLTDLQTTYEIILGKELDKRNFRKKILSLNIIKDTGKKTSGSAHRPAQLFSFVSQKPQVVQIL